MTDEEEFDELYRGSSRRLLQYAYSLTTDLAEAQDLVQEAYVRAWQRWRRLRGYDHVEAWLRLIVTRLATDRWRRLRIRRDAAALLAGDRHVAAPGEQTILLVTAMRRLPVQQRRALALHYLLDLPISDVATEMGAAIGSVKAWLSRGRDALAGALAELAPRTVKESNDVA
jgi:RNA polymerase sigma-70 factor, ECF subfamily